jgi:hypothetical protein
VLHALFGAPMSGDLGRMPHDAWASRSALHTEVARRVARGELRDEIDLPFMPKMLAAPLYFRIFVVGGDSDDEFRERVVDFVRASAGAS